MSLADEISKAIGAHGLWKQRLRGAIDSGKSDISAADAAKDNLCEFGKWLYGPAVSAADKTMPEYQTVKGLHARFHQCASKVLTAALAGKKSDAEAMLANTAEFASVSGDLTRAMMTWKGKAGH